MDCFIQEHDVDGLKKENSRLLSENGELRKMVSLMQENVGLRYALKDHENKVRSLSPPPKSTSTKHRASKKPIDPYVKDDDVSATHGHAKGLQVGGGMCGHGTCGDESGHGTNRSGYGHGACIPEMALGCHGTGIACHGGSEMGCHGNIQPYKDASPRSVDSYDQHMPRHRKLIESLAKFNAQDPTDKDQNKYIQMRKMMSEYK